MSALFSAVVLLGTAAGVRASAFSELAAQSGDLKLPGNTGSAVVRPAPLAEPALVKKIRGHENVVKEYCRVETGMHFDGCGARFNLEKLDLLYVPKDMGERILAHIRQAYSGGYYKNLNKKDFYHGHFISRGPQTEYSGAEEYFNDLSAILYHSREFLFDSWKPIGADENIRAGRVPRSFVGWFDKDIPELKPAIDLIAPGVVLSRSYKGSGTIYTGEVTESVPGLTSRNYSSSARPEDLFIKTGEGGESCKIFDMPFILADPVGRFMSPDGVRFEVFLHCRYSSD